MTRSTQPAGKIAQTISYSITFVVVGLVAASLGPTLTGLAEHTRTQASGISFLFTAHALGYLLGSYQGGWLYDRAPGHRVMATMLVVVAATMALAPVISVLWLLAAVWLVLGVATGALDVGGNTLLVWVHGRQVGPFMNALHFFFGVGAFLSPLIIARAVLISGDITWAYWVLAVLALPAIACLLRLPSPVAASSSEDDPANQTDKRLVLLIAVFLLLYVGAEVSFGGWIFSYALALDLADETAAAYLTSGFWGALTLGRLLTIPIAARFRPRAILLACLLGCLLSLGVILLWPTTLAAVWLGTLGLGFSMASIFPSSFSLAERHMTITGRVSGWFLVGSSLGGMVLPWLIGQLFEPVGPVVAIVAITLTTILAVGVFAALLLALARSSKTGRH